MISINDLIQTLNDGSENAMRASDLEQDLQMEYGNTQEPTRDLIRSAIVNHNMPIGSSRNGFFLIDSEDELNQVTEGLQRRINGIQNRIDGLRNGWNRRQSSREQNQNWPKD